MSKVAILCTKMNEGGAERFAVNLANALSKRNYQVYLLTGKIAEEEYEVYEGVNRVVLISQNKEIISDSIKVRSFCKKNKIDVLIAINLYPNFVACLANRWLKTKVIITERNAPGYLPLSWKTRLLKKVLYGSTDQFVFQTADARDFYTKKIRERSVIIQNPVKANLPYKYENERKEMVAIGRLEKQKNYPNLIRAFSIVSKKYPEYSLKIYGTGTLQKSLISLCEDLGIKDKVIFQGFCFDVHEKIKYAQIYILSSDFEGMPNSLMEAMAMGIPCIATDCPAGGPKAIIEEGINGFLVQVGNSNELADRITDLIENKELRIKVGLNARKIRVTNSEDQIVNEWIDKVIK